MPCGHLQKVHSWSVMFIIMEGGCTWRFENYYQMHVYLLKASNNKIYVKIFLLNVTMVHVTFEVTTE